MRFVKPIRVGRAEFRALDAEIRSLFSDDHIITPDDVRGSISTATRRSRTVLFVSSRCNLANAPSGCRDEWLEPPR